MFSTVLKKLSLFTLILLQLGNLSLQAEERPEFFIPSMHFEDHPKICIHVAIEFSDEKFEKNKVWFCVGDPNEEDAKKLLDLSRSYITLEEMQDLHTKLFDENPQMAKELQELFGGRGIPSKCDPKKIIPQLHNMLIKKFRHQCSTPELLKYLEENL